MNSKRRIFIFVVMEWAVILLGVGIFTCLEFEGVPEDPRNSLKWFKLIVDIGIAAIPGF